MSLRGIDISAYQDEINWDKVKADGIDFVYAKATQGTSYFSDCFNSQHDGAKKAGIPFGAYHFFHFGGAPYEQAEYFLKSTEGRRGTLIPMVDVEAAGQNGVRDINLLVSRLAAFNHTVEAAIETKIIIYTDYGDWNGFMQGSSAFSGHKLWIAEYNNDPAPTLPDGFDDYVIWQYSSQGSVNGIKGYVDMDILNPKYTIEDISLNV